MAGFENSYLQKKVDKFLSHVKGENVTEDDNYQKEELVQIKL